MQSQVMVERPDLLANPNPPWVRVIARLKPGVPIQQAEAGATLLLHQLARDSSQQKMFQKLRLKIDPFAKGYSPERDYFGKAFSILMAIVALILLIACSNVANLFLARSAGRHREIAVRLALGVSRIRLVRQLLTESILLAVCGGALGVLFAMWGDYALLKFVSSSSLALTLEVHPDMQILAFAAMICLLTGLLFGLAPAVQAARVSLISSLKGFAAVPDRRAARFGLEKGLVIFQIAVSLVLLSGAGLFVRTLHNLRSQDMGFDRQHVLLVWTAPSQNGRHGTALANFFPIVQERISSLPGVLSASPSNEGLLSDLGGSPVTVEGHTYTPEENKWVSWNLVAPRYFETTGMRLLLGRDFTETDNESSSRVAIINETMAHYFFGNEYPIGKHFGMRRDAGFPVEIVGVVKDAKYNSLRDQNPKMLFIPYRQDLSHLSAMCVAVRTIGDPAGMKDLIRRALRDTDPTLPVLNIDTMEEQLNETVVQERLISSLSSLFGGLAVLLASVGLYGVMSYMGLRRTSEMGIRMALGATPGNLLAMVLRECLLLVLVGIALGVPATLAATRLISNQLFGVRPSDPITLVGAILLLTAVTCIAGFLPARCAARVDPMVALRYE